MLLSAKKDHEVAAKADHRINAIATVRSASLQKKGNLHAADESQLGVTIYVDGGYPVID